MSVRRRSCEACFRGKRKCDLLYPTCQRCHRNKRTCHYLYQPYDLETSASSRGALSTVVGVNEQSSTSHVTSDWALDTLAPPPNSQSSADLTYNLQLMDELLGPSVPNLIGDLGELQPVFVDERSWIWVCQRLKGCLESFTRRAETDFINRDLYGASFPRPLRTAFGICASTLVVNDSNKAIVLQNLDEEMASLLNSTTTAAGDSSLSEDLSKLQSMVLYQVARFYHGSLRQRRLAEQQSTLLESYGLGLLARLEAAQQDALPTWENWVLAESVRRATLTLLLAHSGYWFFRSGVCALCAKVSGLPVSAASEFWASRDAYARRLGQDEQIRYCDFVSGWVACPARELEPFHKMLVVKCQGIERVEALALPMSV